MSPSALRIRLAQISQRVGENYYLPYSVGLLQAYALQHCPPEHHWTFVAPIYQRHRAEEVSELFADVDIAGFSVYVWNIRRSLMLAERLRAIQPETLIVLGGPQVPDQAEAFLRAHPFVDICCHGEGEALFCELLKCASQRQWDALDGVSWIDENDCFHHRPPVPRSRDLTLYPSPFTSGVFDPLLEEHQSWFSAFESNRGCPFSCTFCDWGSAIQSKVVRFPERRIHADLRWMGAHKIKSVFCADANFGILPRDLEIAQEVADVRRIYGFPKAFQVQSAKNITGRVVEIQQILTQAGLSATAAISLQSLDSQTLSNIKRENISLEAFREIQQSCLAKGIYTYTDIIMGLPGENYRSFVDGVDTVMANGQFNKLMFHDCTLLPNAEMAQTAYREQYGIQSAEIMIPAHLLPEDGLPELMEIVTATAALPAEEWIKAHVFAWSTSFWFYTHKLAQLILMILQKELCCSYQELIHALIEAEASKWPLLAEIRSCFVQSARQQQKGFPESQRETWVVTPSEGTYLTPDLSVQIQWGRQGRIPGLYLELEAFWREWAVSRQADFPVDLLREAVALNRRFFSQTFRLQGCRLEGMPAEEHLQLYSNLPAYYQARLQGKVIPLLWGEAKVLSL